MRARLTCLALALALASPALAKPRQHGNVIFDLPAGWAAGTTRPDGTLVILSDLPNDACAFCYIYIAAGEARAQGPDAWLAANATRFVDADDADKPVVEPISGPELFNFNGRPGAMMGQKVDGDLQMLFAVQLFGRVEMFGFEMPAGGRGRTGRQHGHLRPRRDADDRRRALRLGRRGPADAGSAARRAFGRLLGHLDLLDDRP